MKLSKSGLLKALAELGKSISDKAEPTYYHSHQRDHAIPFQTALTHCRKAYFNINNDLVDPIAELTELKKYLVCIDRNFLQLMLLGLKGELNPNNIPGNWSIVNGFLVFVETKKVSTNK